MREKENLMVPLVLFLFTLNTPTQCQKVCDVQESPLGNTYFRKTTPWGQVIDLPCPTGTVFRLNICGCEKKRCQVLDSDPTVYREFVDAVGDWVTGQCPGGMVYRDDYCMCTYPRDLSTRRPVTMLVTVPPQDCPYRQASLTSYQEYIPSIQDWVNNDCPHGTVYVSKYCKCVTQATVTSEIQSTSAPQITTKTPIQPPTNCKYVKDGASSYKEYIDSLGDWLTYYCSAGKVFSTTWCTCLIDGQTPDYSDMIPPIVKDCTLQPAGLNAYIEYVVEINAWVTNECAYNQVYSQAHCSCLHKDLVHVTTVSPKPTSTTETVTNPNCDLKPVGKNTYQKFEASLQDWVTISCHAGMVFNVLLCHCVQEGVIITGIPEASTVHNTVTNPNCPYIPVGQRSYKEYVPALGDWVSNDCPSDMVFDVNMCSCHPDGSAEIIVVPITTLPPLTIPTVADCPHNKSPDGYNEYIAELDIWINNVCPVNYEFVKLYCTCLSRTEIAKIPQGTASIQPTVTPYPTVPKSATSTHSSTSSTTITSPTVMATTETAHATTFTSKILSFMTSTSTAKPATTTTTAKTTRPTTTVKPPSTEPMIHTEHISTTTPTTATTSKLTRTTTTPMETAKLTRTTITPRETTKRIDSTTTSERRSTTTTPTKTTEIRTSPKTETSTTTTVCDKKMSALGEKYYEKTVPIWGDLTFMCSTGKIFYLQLCDCVSVSDIPTTEQATASTTSVKMSSTTISTPTSTPTITTSTPTSTTTTTKMVSSSSSSTTTSAINTTVKETTTTVKTTLCPLKPSTYGLDYYQINLGTFGSIRLRCPDLQKFDSERCGCYPDLSDIYDDLGPVMNEV